MTFLLRYGIPIVGFLVTAAMWAYIWWLILVAIPANSHVQFNPVNIQDWKRNHYAAKVLTWHGRLWSDHNGQEYGYMRGGKWNSLYRSYERNHR